MSSKIKEFKKIILENQKILSNNCNFLMEELYFKTAIRNEIFLINRELLKKYKYISKDKNTKSKGGVSKMIDGIKGLVSKPVSTSPTLHFQDFSKSYRRFLEHGLATCDNYIDIKELTTEEFVEILDFFPEIIICLNKEVIEDKNWQQVILTKLKNEFVKFNDSINLEKTAKGINLSRITSIGSVKVYKYAPQKYSDVRNYFVLQNCLLNHIELLDEEGQKNPYIYINAFNDKGQEKIFNTDLVIGLRENINQKILKILNLNNPNIFFGFFNFNLFKDIEVLDNLLSNNINTLFEKYMEYIYVDLGCEDLKLSILYELSYYMEIGEEKSKWTEISSYFIKNIIHILKTAIVFDENSDIFEKNNGRTLLSKILFINEVNQKSDMFNRKIERIVLDFLLNSFKYLDNEIKKQEYLWFLENMTELDNYEIILASLARDDALNIYDINNNIEYLLNLYIENYDKYKMRLDVNYIVWLNRFNPKILEIKDLLLEKDYIINFFIDKGIVNNKENFVNKNLQKIKIFLEKVITQSEQSKLFYDIEQSNNHSISSFEYRSLFNSYQITNKLLEKKIDEFKKLEEQEFLSNMIETEINNIWLNKDDKILNQVFFDQLLMRTSKNFKNINMVVLEQEKTYYKKLNCHIKINHILYAMSYEFIGEIAFEFEKQLLDFIKEHRNKNAVEYISDQDMLFFIKNLVYTSAREGYLQNKITEHNKEKEEIILLERITKEETYNWENRGKENLRKKI